MTSIQPSKSRRPWFKNGLLVAAIAGFLGITVVLYVLAPNPNGFERDCIEYLGLHKGLTESLGENVYVSVEFGNALNSRAASAYFCDEEGVNIYGRLFGGGMGLATLFDGSYRRVGDEIIIDWENGQAEIPKRLRLSDTDRGGERITTGISVLLDEGTRTIFYFTKAWDVEDGHEANVIEGSPSDVTAQELDALVGARSQDEVEQNSTFENRVEATTNVSGDSTLNRPAETDMSTDEIQGHWVSNLSECEYDGGLYVEMINGKLTLGCHEWSPEIVKVSRVGDTYSIRLNDGVRGDMSVTIKMVDGGMELSESLHQMCYGQSASRLVKCH